MSKQVLRWIRSGAWGMLSLIGVNVCAAFSGISLGFGWLSGGAAMLFGVPGVLLTLLLILLLQVLKMVKKFKFQALVLLK